MRPRTIAEACTRMTSHETLVGSIEEFLDSYYGALSMSERVGMLEKEPALFEDPRYDAMVGGIAEYLYKRWTPDTPPGWIGTPSRYLAVPWFPSTGNNPGMREYLTWCSPPEFKSRNVMAGARPLRRARPGLPLASRGAMLPISIASTRPSPTDGSGGVDKA